ncbi:PREDICTED: BTB/POZ domain-containing adapter for CUL3-mediated RhoA degradation protein 3-like [Amphimedon queenslandica]|uniref:BTB domain-containing protein n=1 Tax=Amphimedon queenslandica TaxID=400682 RepID=A0AAN0JBG9_AMPQE|nr:PREDICTED: BTB/POZ domain-containing adapter for CUL3-mediated RhoA degradation protein 3-like [Amphimedon queenslandica]|eukprot:XP_019854127.1 PREDICTED: BTB/POZ domain-containing adapter for CUL3-mediated RhoA degradation protein 3-like [Amphimedon queenslandica]
MAECVPTPDSPEPPSDEEYLPVGSGEEEGESGGSGVLKAQTKEHSRYIKLNVGGALFTTTLGTLLKEDNMLRAMFSGRMELQTDEDGWVLIDRSGKHFGLILNFLRDGSVALPESKKECTELLAEAKFYLIDDLSDAVELQLAKLKDEYEPGCRVPVITSPEEEHLIVSSSSKPVVKLLYNRGSNKYSYTPIKFIKDIVGRGEICCWAFYGNARKVAEVCCESIVYATDRKHTKIEFPEAKILEETLNIMLYEGIRGEDTGIARTAHIEPTSRTRRNRTPEGFLSEDQPAQSQQFPS